MTTFDARTEDYIARIRAVHEAEGRDGAAWEARERARLVAQRPRWEEACAESWADYAERINQPRNET